MASKIITKTCQYCNKTFLHTPGSHGKHCSLPCRFWSKVDVLGPDDCWEWKAFKFYGYGKIRTNGKSINAQRVAWELTFGPIPEGLHALHRCDNRACQNPKHIFLGTNYDNVMDRVTKNRSGGAPKGQENCNAKFTDDQVRHIKKILFERRQNCIEIAEQFSVHPETVRRIKRGEAWSHVHL